MSVISQLKNVKRRLNCYDSLQVGSVATNTWTDCQAYRVTSLVWRLVPLTLCFSPLSRCLVPRLWKGTSIPVQADTLRWGQRSGDVGAPGTQCRAVSVRGVGFAAEAWLAFTTDAFICCRNSRWALVMCRHRLGAGETSPMGLSSLVGQRRVVRMGLPTDNRI